MKKILIWSLRIIMILVGVIAFLVVSLFVFYYVLDKRHSNQTKKLQSIPTIIFPSDSLKNGSVSALNLLPVPQKIVMGNGSFSVPENLSYTVNDSLKTRAGEFLSMLPNITPGFAKAGGQIRFTHLNSIPSQGYILDINPENIDIQYSTLQGLYYSVVSLKVLNCNHDGKIPCAHIEDFPDLEVRGLMLDISRNKIPSKATLIKIAELLADLKYNHLELYIEGFSFAYPSFRNLWEGKETPVTGQDIRELDAYCRAHFIDLVPNQNSLGHMMSWLATKEYADLAECPNGYRIMGLINMKGTLNPIDPGSFALVTKMTDDLLPNFTSSNFNVNLDEPFELGKGKSKELCKEKGIGQVYLDYALKLHDLARQRNKNMLMWGDIVMKHPELIQKIPKDVTLLDWGYEASYPYERHCKTLKEAGVSYMVCPGTNSWTSITGRTENMLATIASATTNGVKYGAKGMLLTDWGDMGHWQYPPVSYAGYTCGAALSWNSKSFKQLNLGGFLSSYLFRDRSMLLGDLALDLGRYCSYEEYPLPNMTTTMLSLQFGIRDKIMYEAIYDKLVSGITELMGEVAPELITDFREKFENRHVFDYKGIGEFISSKESMVEKVRIDSPDSGLIRNEYKNAIRLVRLGVMLQKYVDEKNDMRLAEEKDNLVAMKELCSNYLSVNKQLWSVRDRPGGYEQSIAPLNTLIDQIDKRLLLLNKSPFTRQLNRIFEKVSTAGAVLYLKVI